MKIGFDVSQTAEEKAGCGFVADQLIRSLVRNDRKNDYILYPTFYSYRHPGFHKATKPGVQNCKFHFKGMSFKEIVKGWDTPMANRTSWLGNPDIIHSNNFSCVKDHDARIVYTLYDLTPLVCPEFLFEENRLICFDGLFNASTYADHCIAISENTKRDFLDFFPHYPENRITVIPLGTRPGIKRIQDTALKKKVLEKFNINSKDQFWLGVGTIEPRKNFQMLIKAYGELKDDKLLVIAGGHGWPESEMGNKVKQLGLENKVKFLGYAADKELSVLYSSCFAFVYPSFHEGFGLPVLEAMSCGAAVITSNTSSLPGVGGDAACYIDPSSKESLIEQMLFLANNPKKRKEYQTKAIEQAKKFSWENAAKIVLDVYEKTLKNKPYFS
ncbi:MAG: glycosyltransferase family 4 protein [Candidatus Aminicenantes bacterium]|nr:MAG: glycosyltransferase family 4 protein [Candidatus Aminicenantes bacterium]